MAFVFSRTLTSSSPLLSASCDQDGAAEEQTSRELRVKGRPLTAFLGRRVRDHVLNAVRLSCIASWKERQHGQHAGGVASPCVSAHTSAKTTRSGPAAAFAEPRRSSHNAERCCEVDERLVVLALRCARGRPGSFSPCFTPSPSTRARPPPPTARPSVPSRPCPRRPVAAPLRDSAPDPWRRPTRPPRGVRPPS